MAVPAGGGPDPRPHRLRRVRLLPSYVTLAHELNVAPGTVQHAIRVLRAEGLVVTVPGRGTFVAPGAGNAAPV